MKEGCRTSWILQDGTIKLFGWEWLLFLKKRKEWHDTKEDSEVVRAVMPSTGLGRASSSSVSKGGAASPVLAGQDAPALHLRGWCCIQWAWRAQHGTKKDYPQALRSNRVCSTRLCSEPSFLPSFQFLPFGMRMSLLCLHCYCILEAHNLPSFMSSHLERNFAFRINHMWNLLIAQMIFRWDFGLGTWELMVEWVKTFRAIGMEGMYFARDKNMNLVGKQQNVTDWICKEHVASRNWKKPVWKECWGRKRVGGLESWKWKVLSQWSWKKWGAEIIICAVWQVSSGRPGRGLP